jgi:acyl-CoA thioester hydrolase
VQVTTTHRVNYSEVDQMGVVYHANYLVWLDVARCELLRQAGMSYKELEEERGYFLAVSEVRVRYRRAARYDDLLRVRCWVREVGSRKVGFGYAVEHADRNELLATAVVELMSLSRDFTPTRLPAEVLTRLPVTPDPIRVD